LGLLVVSRVVAKRIILQIDEYLMPAEIDRFARIICEIPRIGGMHAQQSGFPTRRRNATVGLHRTATDRKAVSLSGDKFNRPLNGRQKHYRTTELQELRVDARSRLLPHSESRGVKAFLASENYDRIANESLWDGMAAVAFLDTGGN
jgi:hypothetical protein